MLSGHFPLGTSNTCKMEGNFSNFKTNPIVEVGKVNTYMTYKTDQVEDYRLKMELVYKWCWMWVAKVAELTTV